MSAKFAILLSLAVLLVCAFTVRRNTFSRAAQQDVLPLDSPSQQSVVPDHVVYNSLFRKVVRLREKTNEVQKHNRMDGSKYFPMQREAKLSESQAVALEAIAFACRQQVTEVDKKANAIIQAFQSRFHGGRVPPGGSPPPPPELRALWDERTAIILRARDNVRAALGEEEFVRFDNYAKFHYGANTSNVTIEPVRPKQLSK